ncbi:hypothetical protein Tco_0013548 [Tanacetum coccineum]
MADFPNEGSFWNLLNAGTMGSESTSNSQFPGFSSQAPMTPEQQAFLQSQQQAFLAFQQTFQNIQQNPPQQQSQSSNSIPQQTDSQPKRTRVKHAAKRSKGKEAEPTGDVTTLRWSSDEEALLAECFVAVSEDRNVGRSQAKDTYNGLKMKQKCGFSVAGLVCIASYTRGPEFDSMQEGYIIPSVTSAADVAATWQVRPSWLTWHCHSMVNGKSRHACIERGQCGSGDTWHSNHEVRGTVAAGTRKGSVCRSAILEALDGSGDIFDWLKEEYYSWQ